MARTVLVFDMDDTLYPEREFVRSALISLSSEVQVARGLIEFGEKAWELFEAGNRGNLFQLTFDELGAVNIPNDYILGLVSLYREHQPKTLPWFPDALEFFESYHSMVPFSIITDGYLPTQRNKVKALGLDRWATPIICSEELGREFWKPSPKPYLKVMENFPNDTKFVYIADNPIKDFISPRELSWSTVRIRKKGTEHFQKESGSKDGPDAELSNFSDLRRVLSDLCPNGSLVFSF